MAADHLVWRVLHDGNRTGWKVRVPDGTDVSAFTMRSDAIRFARRMAAQAWEQSGELAQIVVHAGTTVDAEVTDQWTYGRDAA